VDSGKQEDCSKENFNATGFASQAAMLYLGSAYVIGANTKGKRPYGRFLPSTYFGNSGFTTPTGEIGGVANSTDEVVYSMCQEILSHNKHMQSGAAEPRR